MEIKEITFQYAKKPLIQKLSTSIEKGKITTIIGPNGSGKSTLLHLLVKQLKPQYGQILFEGKEMSTISTKAMARKLAMVYQQNQAPNDLTVEMLVSYGRSPYQNFFSGKEREEDEKVVQWALQITDLLGLSEKRISELSGGERQRAWIAMALAQKTDILFLDEPTTYLDIFYQLEILRLVKKLNETCNMTIVMVLHDINQAIQFSDQLIVMKSGGILHQGTPEEVITNERLQEVYGINVSIQWNKENQCPYIIPIV